MLKSAIAMAGRVAPPVEEDMIRERFAIDQRPVAIAFAGVLENGMPVIGRIPMATRMCRTWWQRRAEFRDWTIARKGIFRVARRQLIRGLDVRLVCAEQ